MKMRPRSKLKAREKDIQKAIICYLQLSGWEVYRTNNTGIWNSRKGGYFFHGQKGYPDITALKEGLPILFVEVKSPTGKLTNEQKKFAALAQKCHCIYVLARSLEDVINVVQDLTKTWR